MRSSLRATWLDVRASYWFVPAVLTIFATLLGLGTVHLDRTLGPQWLLAFDWYEGSRPESARAQLALVASAMIATAATVFAITIAAVSYASGSYGPRLLTNFMNDRGNQVSLGVFVATFVYNLLILQTIRDAQGGPAIDGTAAGATFVPQLSMLVSGLSVLVAVAVLVFFLHHVPASIRINTVLGGIGRHLLTDIQTRFPIEESSAEPAPQIGGHPIHGVNTGYVEIIGFARLDRIARRHQLILSLAIRTGDFIHPHLVIAHVSGSMAAGVQSEIAGCFAVGDSRSPPQDLEFLIDELVEIGLRALSPAINDPFTAVTSIHWLAAALSELANRDLRAGPEQRAYDPHHVRPLPDDFSHYLRRSFGAMRLAASQQPIAAQIFLQALLGVANSATSAQRQSLLLEEARALVAQSATSLQGPALADVRQAFELIEAQWPGPGQARPLHPSAP